MQLRHFVVTEWICCLIFQRWTLSRHACPIVDISHGLLHSRLKTHLFSVSLKKFFKTTTTIQTFLQVNSMRKRNCSYARDFYQLFSSLRRTGMVFLGTEVPVWFIPVQGSTGMAYRLIPSHFEHYLQVQKCKDIGTRIITTYECFNHVFLYVCLLNGVTRKFIFGMKLQLQNI